MHNQKAEVCSFELNLKESLCVRKSYRYRLAANANAVLFSRFVHVLSPTFLICLQWAQIHRYKYRYTYVTFHIILLLPSSTHLPLLMLMWPIRFVSISHWCFSFRFTISNFYQILPGLYQHQTIYVSSIGCIKVLWSSALYSTWIWICSHDTLQFYFFPFFLSISKPFILYFPTLFFSGACADDALATNAYDNQLWWQMNGVLL